MKSKKIWFLVLVCSGVALSPVFKGPVLEIKKLPVPSISDSDKVIADINYDEVSITLDLYSKVLLTTEEKAKLQAELSNPDLIRKSYLSLTDITSHERVRFQALDYFEKAIAWKENPAREQIIESLKNHMLLDNLISIQDMALRKSYAGDKIEAYAILKEHAPEALEVINTLPEDGRIRKLLTYAENLSKN
jgi:hypothetical protein